MENMRALGLLDSNGKPLGAHIERVLAGLLPKLRRRFPNLQDEVAITEVMEEAGRRIANREERGGPIERLHGYAWVTVRSVAQSYLRRPSTRLIQGTLESEASRTQIALAPSTYGSPEQIERDILIREVLAALSEEERVIFMWKTAGFTSPEIAKFRGRSVVAVDTLFSRAKQKLRRALGSTPADRAGRAKPKPINGTTHDPTRAGEDLTETPDGQHRSTAGGR